MGVAVNVVLELIQDMLLAAVPAVGFALVFNVPREALKLCAIGGGAGHGLRLLLVKADVPIELASFLAASAVSTVGVYWAQRFRAHPKVFTVAAMIPMVPGLHAYNTMLALVEMNRTGYSEALWALMVNSALKTFFIVGGLAVGLALPGLLYYRRRPVV